MVGAVPMLIPYGDVTPFVRREQDGRLTTILLGSSHNGSILMTAEVQATESCPSEVVARGWNLIWNARAGGFSRYLADPTSACP
jgi:hypothetical protein